MARILIVEDDPTQRLIVASILKAAGHIIAEASSGTEGLEIARLYRPDVLVCDVVMPGIDGFQLIAELKKHPETETILVLVLSALAMRSHLRIGMTAGADDYLPKPFTGAELTQAVDALIDKRRVQLRRFADAAANQLAAALEEQKKVLVRKYEDLLMDELNTRWHGSQGADMDLRYADCMLLMADLFEPMLAPLASSDKLREAVRRAYQSATDTLQLFGARHLQPSGNTLLAFFVSDSDGAEDVIKRDQRAVRAAFGLKKSLELAQCGSLAPSLAAWPAQRSATIALARGSASLLHFKDALHGGAVTTLVAGEAFSSARAALAHASHEGWRVCGTASAVDGLRGYITAGRHGLVPAGKDHPDMAVTELLSHQLP